MSGIINVSKDEREFMKGSVYYEVRRRNMCMVLAR